jgi:hypothetical protein
MATPAEHLALIPSAEDVVRPVLRRGGHLEGPLLAAAQIGILHGVQGSALRRLLDIDDEVVGVDGRPHTLPHRWLSSLHLLLRDDVDVSLRVRHHPWRLCVHRQNSPDILAAAKPLGLAYGVLETVELGTLKVNNIMLQLTLRELMLSCS